ncbi:MAG: phosphopantetheine adenylyltransferase [Pseudomonadota bacterium]
MSRQRIIMALIALAGLINFLPVVGVVSGARIESLYGVELADPALEILLRHRAVLFGLVGGFMIIAAFKKSLHGMAIIGGLIAMLSFMGLYYFTSSQPQSLMSIVYADIAGVISLSAALALKMIDRRRKGLR